MEARAIVKGISMSPRKMRVVANLVRGKRVDEAMSMLKLMPKKGATVIRKLIISAVANAEENFGVSRDDLYIAKITADEAPTRKWRRFGARGRFKPILRRNSHVTVVLRERGA